MHCILMFYRVVFTSWSSIFIRLQSWHNYLIILIRSLLEHLPVPSFFKQSINSKHEIECTNGGTGKRAGNDNNNLKIGRLICIRCCHASITSFARVRPSLGARGEEILLERGNEGLRMGRFAFSPFRFSLSPFRQKRLILSSLPRRRF